MFVRVKSTPKSPRKTVQIVESVRDGDKVKQRIVRYVGVAADDFELEKLKDLAEHIKARIEHEKTPFLFPPEEMAEMAIASRKQAEKDKEAIHVNLKELKEEQRSIIGIHEIYGQVYQELGFDSVLPNRRNKRPAQLLKHIVMARIANPSSKRRAVMNLERDFGISLNLHHVYRMMDKINDEAVERLQKSSFQTTQDLLGGKVDVIFVDATTLYFESFHEDDFKKNGYSKDLKFNQPQVLFALMVTKEGLPLGYEAFPGSTYEGNVLLPLLERVKKRFAIDKVIFVADSGLLNNNNLTLLERAGYEYIIGARLRNLSKQMQQKILNRKSYTTSDESTQFLELEHIKNRRLVVSYCPKRAKKDAHDREKAMNTLLSKLKTTHNPKQFISNHRYKKFIQIEGEFEISLNEETLC